MNQERIEFNFEPIVIEQEEINYFNNQSTSFLKGFLVNFKEELDYLKSQAYYLTHQLFVIQRENLINTLTWEEVHERQTKYIQRKQEYAQQIDLKERKIQLIHNILNQRTGGRFQQ